jgi:hypothetical protein
MTFMTKTLTKLLIAAVLAISATAYADHAPNKVALEHGKTVAQFKVGGSRCVLIDDQVHCTLVQK